MSLPPRQSKRLRRLESLVGARNYADTSIGAVLRSWLGRRHRRRRGTACRHSHGVGIGHGSAFIPPASVWETRDARSGSRQTPKSPGWEQRDQELQLAAIAPLVGAALFQGGAAFGGGAAVVGFGAGSLHADAVEAALVVVPAPGGPGDLSAVADVDGGAAGAGDREDAVSSAFDVEVEAADGGVGDDFELVDELAGFGG